MIQLNCNLCYQNTKRIPMVTRPLEHIEMNPASQKKEVCAVPYSKWITVTPFLNGNSEDLQVPLASLVYYPNKCTTNNCNMAVSKKEVMNDLSPCHVSDDE